MYYYYWHRHLNFLNNENLIWILTGTGGFLLLLFVFMSDKTQSVLNTRFIKFIGKLSYAIYLVHGAVLIFVVPRFISAINALGVVNSYTVWALGLLGLLTITFLTAALLNKYIEIPLVKFGNRLIRKKM
jgi:peptidoglycan/LPS O-acetylase OafA/YrhL